MNRMHKVENLKIWNKAIELVKTVYNAISLLPENEKFGLTAQMKRSAVSIPSNIAEGSSKSSDKHFRSYLENSLGSAFEWETQLNIAFRQNYLSEEKFITLENKVQQIEKMISGFRNGLSE